MTGVCWRSPGPTGSVPILVPGSRKLSTFSCLTVNFAGDFARERSKYAEMSVVQLRSQTPVGDVPSPLNPPLARRMSTELLSPVHTQNFISPNAGRTHMIVINMLANTYGGAEIAGVDNAGLDNDGGKAQEVSGVARICCEEGQRWKLCHGALTVDFRAGCSSCSIIVL